MTFQQARAGLRRLTVRAIRPGVDRTRWLLSFLGHPDKTCPAIQITGTNGKGSVAAMLASILKAAGYRTGRFTSPHL
jgi:dihydrofolate synthase/folylpolyglutamate synthase